MQNVVKKKCYLFVKLLGRGVTFNYIIGLSAGVVEWLPDCFTTILLYPAPVKMTLVLGLSGISKGLFYFIGI